MERYSLLPRESNQQYFGCLNVVCWRPNHFYWIFPDGGGGGDGRRGVTGDGDDGDGDGDGGSGVAWQGQLYQLGSAQTRDLFKQLPA